MGTAEVFEGVEGLLDDNGKVLVAQSTVKETVVKDAEDRLAVRE